MTVTEYQCFITWALLGMNSDSGPGQAALLDSHLAQWLQKQPVDWISSALSFRKFLILSALSKIMIREVSHSNTQNADYQMSTICNSYQGIFSVTPTHADVLTLILILLRILNKENKKIMDLSTSPKLLVNPIIIQIHPLGTLYFLKSTLEQQCGSLLEKI